MLTWMEIYTCGSPALSIADGTPLRFELATGTPVLAEWIDGQRHVEAFVACVS